jgi:hypothetical protein
VTSRFLATTLLDVYRDNATGNLPVSGALDGYDEPVPATVPVLRQQPAHVALAGRNAGSRKTYDPVTGRVTIIESWSGRARPGTDIRPSDRIHDTRTGNWFIVDGVNQPATAIGAADVTLSLTRVTR